MNSRMERWGFGSVFLLTGNLIYHFMKGRRIFPKLAHGFFFVYLNHHIYVLAKSMGVLVNLGCRWM